MKGYKALDWDMRAAYGNEMQYKLGKTYTVYGKVVPCENGFHFCEKIEELNCCYDIASSRILNKICNYLSAMMKHLSDR